MTEKCLNRRQLLAGSTVVLGTLAAPAILRAQSSPILLGHLTPRTGFLGPMGEYAVMAAELAVEQINAEGGVLGRQIELIKEDSINPQTATSKAERMIERDQVAAILGEISSASAQTIGQVTNRLDRIFINTGANSDFLRGEGCQRTMFHTEAQNVMYVNAEGQYFLEQGLVKGKKWYMLSADYAFGHDLRKGALAFTEREGAEVVGDDLVPTDAADFSSYLLSIRAANPDLVVLNLAGTQQSSFFKQFGEFGFDYTLGGFDYNTILAWAAGVDNFRGTWPCVWTHQVQTDGSQQFATQFTEKYGKPPENQAYSDFVAMKIIAKAIAEVGGTKTEDLVTYFESEEAEFDILKSRPGRFDPATHQLLQEVYAVTAVKPSEAKNEWDIFTTSGPLPAAEKPLTELTKGSVGGECTFG
ncbi:ABC transporter substrate-binding protein [Chelativorans sp. YIM 93263]|uniref:ABC transporter substrate-binding protein n=1 Tax=Chelativorans sp. YIM 93263 TaxID=2906648 RepID=UPI0023785A5C|nr:ABC transporter substrate-binding protein [Chelativorans sp. YIM 93263]